MMEPKKRESMLCQKHTRRRAQVESLIQQVIDAPSVEEKARLSWGVIKETELLVGCRQCKRWVESRELTAVLLIEAGRPA